MPDQTPAPLHDDDLLDIAERADAQSCDTVQAIARELIHARARIAELEKRRDQHRRDYRDLHISCEKHVEKVHEFRVYLAEIVDALGEPEDTRFDVLPESARAARARITELEAFVADLACHGLRCDLNPTVNSAGDMYAQMTDYLRRVNTGLRERARALVPDANVPYSGGRPMAKLRPESAPAEPHAYIAVKRLHSPNATKPEWDAPARVIPAGDPHGVQDWYEREGYEFLPIVGTETATRPATTPQSDPDGYAVVVDVDGGRIVQTSALLPESVAVARAENYRTEFGMTTHVYEMREVAGDA